MSGPMTEVADAEEHGLGAAWLRFWFEPADPRPLAIVRVLVGLLGLALLGSWEADLDRWFGPRGLVSPAAAAAWGDGGWAAALDLLIGARATWAIGMLSFAALLVGAGGSGAAVMAAGSLSLLLHRGPMLAGPADDCLAVLTWCTAVGPATATLSIDRLVTDRRRSGAAETGRTSASWRARLALGLLQVHASVIALAAALAQLKGDVWWDGTASWWLAARVDSRMVDLTPAFAASTYLMNLATHAIPGFEVAFAVGLWWPPMRLAVARLGLVAWPAIGVLVGEPYWGLAMAVFAVPFALRPTNEGVSMAAPVSRRRAAS